MEKKFKVEGMMCEGCASSVKKKALSVAGVKDATVNLAENLLTVVSDAEVSDDAIIKAVTDAGFDCEPFK